MSDTPARQSLSRRLSNSVRQIAATISLGIYLDSLEGLDFTLNNSVSRFNISSRPQHTLDLTDMCIDEESPAGQEASADDDGLVGISPRHSNIAGIFDPGRVCLTSPGAFRSSEAVTQTCVAEAEDRVPLVFGPLVQDHAMWSRQTFYVPPQKGVLPLGSSPSNPVITDAAATTFDLAQLHTALQHARNGEVVSQQPAVAEVTPVRTRLSRLRSNLPDYSAVPWGRVLQLLAVWLLHVGLQLGRSHVGKCSPAAWGLYAAQLAAMALLGLIFTLQLRNEGRLKRKQLFEILAEIPNK